MLSAGSHRRDTPKEAVSINHPDPQDEKMFISQEASPIFPNLNCVFMYKKAKFPSKFQNFPPHINISWNELPKFPIFFSPCPDPDPGWI